MKALRRFFKKDQYKNLFLLLWLLLGLLQACYTELMDDEAYYWVYSRHLDWGYFDHPPMIALLIKMGYALFHNELGVRLLVVLLNVATLWLLQRMLPQKDNRLYYWLLGAMGAMQVGGMIAVPDLPLIFFATYFFLVYRNFLQKQNWKNTLLLGLSMALMFYSKYHGILLVFFIVLSNLNLLRVFRFYVAVAITTVLFFPHLYWQYSHHFPSLQYHLVERNAVVYQSAFTTDYLIGQVLLFGPVAGWLLLYYGIACPLKTAFERGLKYCLIGVLLFFLLSTLKGRVEGNWTVMLFTPVMYLAHQYILRRRVSRKPLYILVPITLLIVIAARIYLVYDFIPGIRIRPEVHNNKNWTARLQQQAAGRPVVFINSYQLPSKYMFYTGETAYCVNDRASRRNQYNFWDTETQLWGKPALVVFHQEDYLPVTDSLILPYIRLHEYASPRYYSYQLIQFETNTATRAVKTNADLHFRLAVKNNYASSIAYDTANIPLIGYSFLHLEDELPPVKTALTLPAVLGQDSVDIAVKAPATPGLYKLKFSVFDSPLPPTHNSQNITLNVQ
ncbi:Dolichyl-phosphate-mannose-protein mannosyltransferase [Chitinophaga costaii]|uniref:Dolichyl-phosphate-mannose-protein mannosyltransferase n=1 Tax=Chitinophaga costaii TaxID=1335309 RepID=A0A1C4FPE8_9BACT|nr:glycosyltransferase family 39 protein [Chitinophaga costaii]PUZ20434.1 hypothetical protein DCM91_18515 [Chitinophaga costaii]SCC57848.1 Dolichyl-phosphate-mannose-protein mannosyltransferase [Chitinophaga costaii]